MSDPKNISPLLDGFTLGAPMCEHNGVICHPAIKENTTKKYIVKILTIPPSQSQLDALLLAGAYKDPADAMDYFRRIGEDILKEAELLTKLSKLEGFLPYDGWQMEPITRRRLGYEIYLVGSYKRSLEKYMAKNALTHLEAINLGLDLCAALSVCRQCGYLYVALKPSNIYVSEKKEYRIGDLGFLSLDSLRYASMPERCFSSYTPPELLDPMAAMNLTVDTYAVGMILYQLYNDGHLPFSGLSPALPLPAPVHADYELAEIIMKAIHPDPEQRWTDPKDLGKAIASYMQRNSVNDIPITPFIPLDVNPEQIVQPASEPDLSEAIGDEQAQTEIIPDSAPSENDEDAESDSIAVNEPAEAEPSAEEASEPDQLPAEPDPEPEAEISEVATPEEETICEPEQPSVPLPADTLQIEEQPQKVIEFSEEVTKIIAKADDLIAHDIPEDAVFHSEPEEDPFAFVREDSEDTDDALLEDPDFTDSDEEPVQEKKKATKHFADTSGKKKLKKFFSRVFLLLILCAIAVGGLWFYRNFYLQTIDSISVTGTQTEITVLLDTDVDEAQLVVSCTDSSGNSITESVKGGKATFQNLKPNTQYTLDVNMTGFHKLMGKTSDVFTTDATTKILSFDAIAGSEDGSVVLEFTVDGFEPDFWNIRYSAEGEEELRETITNHSTMITGLTVGKVYTFTLDGGQNFGLSGETSLQYMAAKLILAENIHATSDNGSDVTIRWDTPGDVVIESWNVRCYDGYGFEKEVTVTETKALLTGLDSTVSYTVEVTAAGMTAPCRFDLSADPINLTAFHMDESGRTNLNISWDFTGEAPEDGWKLFYTVDGSGSQIVETQKPSASIEPLIPGATYRFMLQSADGRTVLNNSGAHETAAAEKFTDNNFIPENCSFDLLKTPEDPNWYYEMLEGAPYTGTFAVSDSASMVLSSKSTFYLPGYETKALFVFRNSYGNVLPEVTAEETFYWKDIWASGESTTGELDIPKLPSTPGSYTMELYFNGKYVTKFGIQITE